MAWSAVARLAVGLGFAVAGLGRVDAALSKGESERIRAYLKAVPHPEPVVDWQNYAFRASRAPGDSYAYTKNVLKHTDGLELIGYLPSRPSQDLGPTALGVGYEGSASFVTDDARTLDLIAAAGVKKLRLWFSWNKFEKKRGEYDFSWLDKVLDLCEQRKIEPWVSLGGCPSFYLTGCEDLYPTPPEMDLYLIEGGDEQARAVGKTCLDLTREAAFCHGAMEPYLKAVAAFARHVRGRVRHIEYNNEIEAFFRKGGTDWWRIVGHDQAAKDMVECCRRVRETVLREIPEAEFSVSFCRLTSSLLPRLAAHGLAEVIDFYSYHGYERNPEAMVRESLDQARALFRRKDGTPVRVMMGESGRASGPSGRFSTRTEYGQAKFTARRIFNDLYQGSETVSFFGFGLGRYGYVNSETKTPKLGYYVLQSLGWLIEGLRPAPEYCVRFNTLGTQEFTPQMPYTCSQRTAFVRKGVPVVALWTPEHLDINQQPLTGCLSVVTDGLGESFPEPVVIDTVRRTVWDAKALHGRDWIGDDEFRYFPLLDYPLVVTDLAVFREFVVKE